MKLDMDKLMIAGNGILILGAAWLLFWLGPAFFLFKEDPKVGNFQVAKAGFIWAMLMIIIPILSISILGH